MPYFIYRISPPRTLDHIDTKEKYQDARTLVRGLRAELDTEGEATVRMVFAKSNAEAEKLLLIPRDERVIGED